MNDGIQAATFDADCIDLIDGSKSSAIDLRHEAMSFRPQCNRIHIAGAPMNVSAGVTIVTNWFVAPIHYKPKLFGPCRDDAKNSRVRRGICTKPLQRIVKHLISRHISIGLLFALRANMKQLCSFSVMGLALGFVCLVGCGGAQQPPNDGRSPDGPAHLEHEGGTEAHEEHHMKVFPTLDEFHDVFAPIWHTENDSERTSKACEKVGAIHAQAQKIEEGPVPEKATDQAAWKAEAHSLMEDADGLKKDCDVGREAVLPRLKSLHEGFHKLLDRASGKLQK